MNHSGSKQNRQPIAVITGGASGIGLAIARSYAREGTRVLLADIDRHGLQHARDELIDGGATVDCAVVDLRDPVSVSQLGAAAKRIGTLSAVCLNAGVMATGSTLWETSEEVFDFLIGVNLRGLFESIRTFVPILLEQAQPAEIVITASMAGMVSSGFSGAYGASKSGAVALAKALRVELATVAPYLKVAVLNPGMVRTNLILRSAAELGTHSTMPEDTVRDYHDSLNQIGVPADEAARWARRALDENHFWAFPSGGDPFMQMLENELVEIRQSCETD